MSSRPTPEGFRLVPGERKSRKRRDSIRKDLYFREFRRIADFDEIDFLESLSERERKRYGALQRIYPGEIARKFLLGELVKIGTSETDVLAVFPSSQGGSQKEFSRLDIFSDGRLILYILLPNPDKYIAALINRCLLFPEFQFRQPVRKRFSSKQMNEILQSHQKEISAFMAELMKSGSVHSLQGKVRELQSTIQKQPAQQEYIQSLKVLVYGGRERPARKIIDYKHRDGSVSVIVVDFGKEMLEGYDNSFVEERRRG